MADDPRVSVVIPTYKRLELLKRAIACVRSQTTTGWELLISDDEEPAGETWQYLQGLADGGGRVRVLRNPGPHGQCGNMNNLLRHAKGAWIKPLFDDDLLRPTCLEVMLDAVGRAPGVAMASCRVASFAHGKIVKEEPWQGRPLLELIPQRYVHLGMYLQEDVGLGIPTQVIVRRDVVQEKGAWFQEHPGLFSGVDTLWYMNVLKHGDQLIINRVLAEQFQGEHVTVTSQMTEERMDAEFSLLRRMQYKLIEPDLPRPSLRVALQALRLIRSSQSVANGRFVRAVTLAASAWHPAAWRHALRWYLRRRWPQWCGRTIPCTAVGTVSSGESTCSSQSR